MLNPQQPGLVLYISKPYGPYGHHRLETHYREDPIKTRCVRILFSENQQWTALKHALKSRFLWLKYDCHLLTVVEHYIQTAGTKNKVKYTFQTKKNKETRHIGHNIFRYLLTLYPVKYWKLMLISNFDRLPIKINHVWPMMTFCVLKWLKVQTQTSLQQCMNKIHHHVIQNLRNANNPQICFVELFPLICQNIYILSSLFLFSVFLLEFKSILCSCAHGCFNDP